MKKYVIIITVLLLLTGIITNVAAAQNNNEHWRDIWAELYQDQPELFNIDYDNEQEKTHAIRNNLTGAGVGFQDAAMIVSRHVSDRVGAPPVRLDGTVAGSPNNGYGSIPNSIKSEEVRNNVFVGTGYAYIDMFSFPHVVRDLGSALKWTADGNVYEYEGRFGRGYALDEENLRAFIELPEAEMYGNIDKEVWDELEGEKPPEERTPDGKVLSTPIQLTDDLEENGNIAGSNLTDYHDIVVEGDRPLSSATNSPSYAKQASNLSIGSIIQSISSMEDGK